MSLYPASRNKPIDYFEPVVTTSWFGDKCNFNTHLIIRYYILLTEVLYFKILF